jgi:hypothetical protein
MLATGKAAVDGAQYPMAIPNNAIGMAPPRTETNNRN